MVTIDLEKTSLSAVELIALLSESPEAEVQVVRGASVIGTVQLKSETAPDALSHERIPGLGKGTILYISDDFDAPLPEELWSEDDELFT